MIALADRRSRLLLSVILSVSVKPIALRADASSSYPSPSWDHATAAEVGMNGALLEQAKEYSLTAGGSGLIIRNGKVALRWGDQRKRYDIKSATKSFGATMLGLAVKDGRVKLSDFAWQHHDSFGVPPRANGNSGWARRVTLLHLATQTAGFEKPGGYGRLLFVPGTHWHYSDAGPNWLGECLTLEYQRDLQEVMFERLFLPLSISRDDVQWRKNQYRDHKIKDIVRREFGAGIHANVEAMSRLGYLYLREGRWNDQQLLPTEFVRLATRPVRSVVGIPEWDAGMSHGNASEHYGLLWWNNADGALKHVPRDAFWAWGLYDSLIVVIPSLDLVVVRAGERRRQLQRDEDGNHYDVLGPLLDPIVAATGRVVENASLPDAPYPASDVILDIQWAPIDSIIRKAEGSDNWPITWGDDDLLYTAYGDGWGFEPMTKRKLSLGLASVSGTALNFQGLNIRSAAEKLGQGAAGEKASGMLMVEGVLYMWVRNARNSMLGWSSDYGKTWTWADWKFDTSFGCPTFLNFGKNYSDVPELLGDFVYVYSHDHDSAYAAADRMVLARVPKDKIGSRQAYEFYQRFDPMVGLPEWTHNIEDRGSVFHHAGNCYRSGITYNPGLKRFLWCQTLPASSDERGPRFQGGFGIYEAPAPWGPWKTVYFSKDWDVGPGETNSFPTKWMSADGKTVHLVFSGDDCFSVREAKLVTW